MLEIIEIKMLVKPIFCFVYFIFRFPPPPVIKSLDVPEPPEILIHVSSGRRVVVEYPNNVGIGVEIEVTPGFP